MTNQRSIIGTINGLSTAGLPPRLGGCPSASKDRQPENKLNRTTTTANCPCSRNAFRVLDFSSTRSSPLKSWISGNWPRSVRNFLAQGNAKSASDWECSIPVQISWPATNSTVYRIYWWDHGRPNEDGSRDRRQDPGRRIR